MKNILFINTNYSWNKGSAAQIISASKIIRNFVPDSNFSLISYCPEFDSMHNENNSLKIVGYFSEYPRKYLLFLYHLCFSLFICSLYLLLKKIGINAKYILSEKYLYEYSISDIIIDLSGDSFSDSKGGRSIVNVIGILIGILLGKPIVFFSQSIGPFNKWTLPLSTFCLNKATLIIVRENITKEYLTKIGVISPIYLTADCAFILNSASSKVVDDILSKEHISINSRPLIGVSVNIMLDDDDNHYATTMAKLIEYLIQNLNAQVIFIPHVVSIKKGGQSDDRKMAKKIYELIENKAAVGLIEGDYSPEELKGIIRLSDLFIGGRMHANIAALSSNIPTLATSWSHKYYGIMRTLGQEKYVCNSKTMEFDELKLKVDELWANRLNIKAELQQRGDIQKKLAIYSGELVGEVIQNRVSSKI